MLAKGISSVILIMVCILPNENLVNSFKFLKKII